MKIEVTQYGRKISMDLAGDDQSLTEMVETFEDILKALGYVFDGHFTMIEEGE
jgi:hypothetical protein